MAKSFSNSVALNFISSAQQKEAQDTATETKPVVAEKTAKPAKAEKKTAAKTEPSKAPKSKVKDTKVTKAEVAAKQEKPVAAEKTAKPTKPAKPAKAEKPTPKTPDLPMLNLNIPVVERKSTRVQLLIKPSLVEKLKAIAKAKNTSVNDLVNVILETVLK